MLDRIVEGVVSALFKQGARVGQVALKYAAKKILRSDASENDQTPQSYNEGLLASITSAIIKQLFDNIFKHEAALKASLKSFIEAKPYSAEDMEIYKTCFAVLQKLNELKDDETLESIVAKQLKVVLLKLTKAIINALQTSLLGYYEHLPNIKLDKHKEQRLITELAQAVFQQIQTLNFTPSAALYLAIEKAIIEKVAQVLSNTNYNQQLFAAIDSKKDLSGVEILRALALGADINARNTDGCTPLQAALIKQNYSTAQFLIESGARVNEIVLGGKWSKWTCLGIVLFNGNVNGETSLLKLLLDNGADPNLPIQSNDSWAGWTPLCIAVHNWRKKYKNHVEIVKQLLEQGADANLALKNTQNSKWSGWTPLTLVLRNRHNHDIDEIAKIVDMLLKAGADANAAIVTKDDWHNWLPLVIAVHNWKKTLPGDFPKIVQLLLQQGANPNQKLQDTKDKWSGWTPLALAIQNRHGHDALYQEQLVKCLLQHGASLSMAVQTKDSWKGYTPLQIAEYNALKNIIVILNEHQPTQFNDAENAAMDKQPEDKLQNSNHSPRFFQTQEIKHDLAHAKDEATDDEDDMYSPCLVM